MAGDWPDRIFVAGVFDSLNGVQKSTLAALHGEAGGLSDVIVNAIRDAQGFSFTLPATAKGKKYAIERAKGVEQRLWTTLETMTGDGEVKVFSDLFNPSQDSFYRLRVE